MPGGNGGRAATGILTGSLARLGADVTAVEPDRAMLAGLRRQLETSAGEFTLPLLTVALRAVRRP